MVYYRKYRPQKIEELDSKSVRDKLYSVLESKSVSHAFLFTGPKGLGKTSAARIVAKVLNCERLAGSTSHVANKKEKISTTNEKRQATSGVEPCNKCEQCASITKGTNMDILEIDGASNRGIDEIRDLREKVNLSPMRARRKIYIIDEVHMLTTEAFNALLKTLEEPPSHVVFILCTTEPHKVPGTIKSRCLQIQFKKATEEELMRSFERIAKEENLKTDRQALSLIASLSDGSFRDGVKILEEMSHSAGFGQAQGKKITTELIEQKFQISSIEYQTAHLIGYLEGKDTKSALGIVSKLVEDGVEMEHFMQELIETLHNNLLFKAGIENSPLRPASPDFAGQAKLEMGELKKLIELLAKAHSELKYTILPQLPLELAIVEWGLQAQKNADANAELRRPIIQRDSASGSASFSKKTNVKKEVIVNNPPAINTQQDMTKYSENDALWTALIDKVKTYNHTLAGVLRGCRIKSYDGNSLIIEANFKFHKDKLSEPKPYEILEEACKTITKKNVKIEVLLKGGEA